jgi:hypothetical protein
VISGVRRFCVRKSPPIHDRFWRKRFGDGRSRDGSADHAVTRSNNHSIIGGRAGQRAAVDGPFCALTANHLSPSRWMDSEKATARANAAPRCDSSDHREISRRVTIYDVRRIARREHFGR